MPTTRLKLSDVEQLARHTLLANGCDKANAEALTVTITSAERDGSHSHGLFRLPGYIASLRSGKVNGKANPTVEQIAPAALRVHGDNGFTPRALEVTRDPLVERAKSNGIAVAAITRTYHFAALWPETTALAEHGLAAFAFTSAKPSVAPAGGTRPLFGTNPMSFAWPRRGTKPMVFDQASAAMARGEIMIAARDGHDVPEHAGIKADGSPTTDPAEILNGAQLAFGGYKGAMLALMVELLAGPLVGEVFSIEQRDADNNDGGPAIGGELLIAIDPVRLSGNPDVFDHAEKLFSELTNQQGTRLPADRRYQHRIKAEAEGIEIPTSLYETISELS